MKWLDLLKELINEIWKDKKHRGSSVAIVIFTILLFVGGVFGFTKFYVDPHIEQAKVEQKRVQDSLAMEQKFKETLLYQKLDGINDNIQDLKESNKEIKSDIKGLLKRR